MIPPTDDQDPYQPPASEAATGEVEPSPDDLARRADMAGLASLATLVLGSLAVTLAVPNHGGQALLPALAPIVAISIALGARALRQGARGVFRLFALLAVVLGGLVVASCLVQLVADFERVASAWRYFLQR